MSELPETRESLLLQMRDPENAPAWEQFCATYRPAIYRLARRRGLQDAEAEDLAQLVMVNVSRAIGGWKDATRGTFRSWLLRIARNAIVNVLSRGRLDAARGGTSVVERLEQFSATEDAIATLIDDEHRRAVFRWAADEVRSEFQEATWLAFWMSTVEDLSIDRTAAQLGKSVGSVYAARSRVMRRLKEKVCEFDGE